MAEGRDRMRASDSDRAAVAERLRAALDEGRLDFTEYDERLQRAYASKTYAELDGLLTDLPDPAAPNRSQLAPFSGARSVAGDLVPGPDGRYPHATRRWLADTWDGYVTVVAIVVAIWGVISVLSGELMYFWPAWVAGPWGAVLVAVTVSGLLSGEPQRWAAKRARKEEARRERRAARRRRRDQPGGGEAQPGGAGDQPGGGEAQAGGAGDQPGGSGGDGGRGEVSASSGE